MKNLGAAIVAIALAGCAGTAAAPDTASHALDDTTTRLAATPCPPALAGVDARCLTGQDVRGAFLLVAIPSAWNGTLVVHAHGGPTLGEPRATRAVEDLTRWAIMVKAGYAWAASTFAQGGVAVHAAAADTERLRRIVVREIGVPRRTILHGQSWGAGVAAVAASAYGRTAAGGRPPYDAVLLTNGVLGGGSRSYDFRLDLRVVYQFLCGNHPRADEPAYPLWMGLPPGSTLTSRELAARVDACLGTDKPAAQRSPEQARKLRIVTTALAIPERSVRAHLSWATWHFQDIVQNRTGGASPFGNIGARYVVPGDADATAALNAGVARYRADPAAARAFAADTDPDGRIAVPVLSLHAIDDPTAFVELEDTFRRTMAAAGRGGNLVQLFTDDDEHSYLADPVYPAAMTALLGWVDRGEKPDANGVAKVCAELESRFGPGCRFKPDYRPNPLASRIVERERP